MKVPNGIHYVVYPAEHNMYIDFSVIFLYQKAKKYRRVNSLIIEPIRGIDQTSKIISIQL